MTPPPLNALSVFLAVARKRSFTAAARELAISPSAVSQSIRQLEDQLGVPLLARTTRSVALTEVGRRLLEGTGPALAQITEAMSAALAKPGELTGRLRLSVPRIAVPFVIEPVLPRFRAAHPGVEVEVSVDDRLVDVVGEGFDAGVRLSEAIERDMVQVRLTRAFRFLVVGAPDYLDERGEPSRPEDLLEHDCIGYRSPTDGAPYAWELERGKRSWRLPVKGPVSSNDAQLCIAFSERGLGLTYACELLVEDALRRKRLRSVLEPFAPTVPGFFAYFPSRARLSPALRAFVELAKAVNAASASRA